MLRVYTSIRMCVCVCIYAYIHMYINIYTHTHSYIHIHIYTYVYINISLYIYIYIERESGIPLHVDDSFFVRKLLILRGSFCYFCVSSLLPDRPSRAEGPRLAGAQDLRRQVGGLQGFQGRCLSILRVRLPSSLNVLFVVFLVV